MAELLTPQQQRFVLAIIEGKTQAEAYKAARFPRGGKPTTSTGKELTVGDLRKRGSEMYRTPALQAALARARAAAADRAGITVDDLVVRLERVYEASFTTDPPQLSAAVASAMGIGKLLGLVVDRGQLDVVHHKPSPSPEPKALELSTEEWRRMFQPSK